MSDGGWKPSLDDAQDFIDVASGVYHPLSIIQSITSDPIVFPSNSDEGLDGGLKLRTLIRPHEVCGRYGVVPPAYVLTGVVRDESVPQKASVVPETWKGTYEAKPVVST